MRAVLWLLCMLCVVGIFYAGTLHERLSGTRLHGLVDTTIVQVVLGALAGIFATKASDSSREIKALLKIGEIEGLLGEAQSAESRAQTQKAKLDQIERLLTAETEGEFARDMISRHRDQLNYHWGEILKLESLLEDVDESAEDADLRNRVRAYLIKSRYIDYMGRGFLRSIPVFGRLLHMLLGPFWDEWYYRNMHAINKKFRATATKSPTDADAPSLNRDAKDG